MPQIGFIGRELDLAIRAGSDFGPHYLYVRNPDLTPVNLTGMTFEGQIRRSPAQGGTLVANVTFEVVDALTGKLKFFIPAATTDTMPALGSAPGIGKYQWMSRMRDALSRPTPMFYGVATVYPEGLQ
jgi:hypothetical protein